MKRRTLEIWQMVGQIEFAIFFFLAVFGLVLGLTGFLDEDGRQLRWYQCIGAAFQVIMFGLPGLWIDFLTRRALRRSPPEDETRRGFEPVLKSDD